MLLKLEFQDFLKNLRLALRFLKEYNWIETFSMILLFFFQEFDYANAVKHIPVLYIYIL